MQIEKPMSHARFKEHLPDGSTVFRTTYIQRNSSCPGCGIGLLESTCAPNEQTANYFGVALEPVAAAH
jgi:hypothetical protein